jgi:hypothetical protein
MGKDYWTEDLSWIKCWYDDDIDRIVQYLADNMKLYDRERNDPPVPAKDVFTPEDFRAVKALYAGVLHAVVFCGVVQEDDRFGKAQVALDTAEFAFMRLHPDYSSYESFYNPVRHVVDYMKNHREELLAECERRNCNA